LANLLLKLGAQVSTKQDHKTIERLVRSLAVYARLRRSLSPDYRHLGDDARETLALHLGIDVAELEPGTQSAYRWLADL
jgi:hypothetical protein